MKIVQVSQVKKGNENKRNKYRTLQSQFQ